MGMMIDAKIKSGQWAGISCPETSCKIKLRYEDIRAFADDETFDRFASPTKAILTHRLPAIHSYESILLRRTLATMPGYMGCKRPEGCGWGQIHPPRGTSPIRGFLRQKLTHCP